MASSKVMPSTSNSTNSDLNSLSSHHHHHHRHHRHHHHHRNHPPSSSQMISDFTSTNSDLQQRMNIDGILRDVVYAENAAESGPNTLLDAEITLIDAAGAISAIGNGEDAEIHRSRKTAEEVWREIVSGKNERKECKVEAPDEMMTLEDFLAKAGAGMEGEEEEEEDVKFEVSGGMQMSGGLFAFDHPLAQSSYPQPPPMPAAMGGVMVYGDGGSGSGGGIAAGGGGSMEVLGGVRGKRRGGPILEPLDKAAQQRQRRMIKNRESAARSRERKQAYQVELETLAMKLEKENEELLREKAARTKERFKQLMEKVVPVVKKKPPHVLRRVRSMQW
ncbi:G-box-binding factor 4 isoform X2 [Beta vulgaris subsp. vulgaris]|uniref:G-box-binding factor 4 isoform X2 n=1 Tax=Beta vulgaris subsp. vulgaris TaxID=3555 RepID=UPI00053F9D3C|nr:G-box-binding factor 4 isoform X2 [Beta vulgaris subsp. vulgaris]